MGGFRAAIDAAAPELRQARDLLHTLVDDVPGATLISGHALGASGQLESARTGFRPLADQCAGFVTGGVMTTMFASDEAVIVTGPPAPDLRDADDPLAWHEFGGLPLHGMRRVRRVDVTGAGTAPRWPSTRCSGTPTSGATEWRRSSTSTPCWPPWIGEPVGSSSRARRHGCCPGGSVPRRRKRGRITGMTLPELHSRVRRELHGTSTCTHLNDLLRSVADAEALIALLPAD